MNLINKRKETLTLIKEQTGLRLNLCDHFTGIRFMDSKPYFNVVLKVRISESLDYDKLKRWSDKFKLINIESNGLKRLAIFI